MKEIILALSIWLGLPADMPPPKAVIEISAMEMAIEDFSEYVNEDGEIERTTIEKMKEIPFDNFEAIAKSGLGLYKPHREVIWINVEALNNLLYSELFQGDKNKLQVYKTGILVHELYHHWQNMSWKIRKARCKGAGEAEAYQIQNKYYEEMGYPDLKVSDTAIAIMGMCRRF